MSRFDPRVDAATSHPKWSNSALKISAFGLAVAAALAAHSSQAIMIDDFESGYLEFPGVFAMGPAGTASNSQSGTMLGGQRAISLQMLTGSGVSVVTVPSAAGALNIDNGVNERSNVTVVWNTSPVDLTDAHTATGFFLTIPSKIDHPMDVSFTVTSATGTSTGTRQFADGTSGNFFVPFSIILGGATFEQATQVTLALTSPDKALDTQVTLVETRGVPLPGTLSLLGLGLAGLARRGRRG